MAALKHHLSVFSATSQTSNKLHIFSTVYENLKGNILVTNISSKLRIWHFQSLKWQPNEEVNILLIKVGRKACVNSLFDVFELLDVLDLHVIWVVDQKVNCIWHHILRQERYQLLWSTNTHTIVIIKTQAYSLHISKQHAMEHENELLLEKVHILQGPETCKSKVKRLTCYEFIPRVTDKESNTMVWRIHLTGQT